MHYSFNYGNVHFISLDTETGYPGAREETRYVLPCGGFGDQLAWLEQDLILANEQRALRPWIFVAGHRPMYDGDSINTDFQTAVEKLFYDYSVDIYFCGHEHFYERDYPVYQGITETTNYTNPLATTHILIGGAGNDEMRGGVQLDRSIDPSPRDKPSHLDHRIKKQKKNVIAAEAAEGKKVNEDSDGPWTAVTDKDNYVGIGKVTIIDDNQLQFDYIRTLSGEIFDTITLTRDHSSLLQMKNKKQQQQQK